MLSIYILVRCLSPWYLNAFQSNNVHKLDLNQSANDHHKDVADMFLAVAVWIESFLFPFVL